MSNIKNTKLFIKGMHCRSCELLIEEKLKEIPKVKAVNINYRRGEATIKYEGDTPPLSSYNKAISDAGYQIGSEGVLPLITRDRKEYIGLGVAFLFLMALYLVLRGLGLSNINLSPDLSDPTWGLIIIIGLVAGFSTCMALVGGLSLGISSKFLASHPQASTAQKFRPHLYFILGRIISYGLLGGLLGVLGAVFKLSTLATGILTFIVALVMLIMGLQLINIFPRLNRFKLTLPKSIAKALGFNRQSQEYSPGGAMTLGALTFFLPCGFTQAMQLYAISTGDVVLGALVMSLFALGTAPGLLSIGGLTSLVKGSLKERFFKVAGLAIIFFSLFNISNAYTLASLNFSGSISNTKQSRVVDPNVSLENGVQVVRMNENKNGYSPNKFSIKRGVPVKWIIQANAPYSCASVLVVPKLKIQKFLVAGENIIEFTPKDVGNLPFSCSMGMYTGVFNVYDDDAEDSSSAITNTALAAPAGKVSANSCQVGSKQGSCGGGATCACGGQKKVLDVNSVPVVAEINSDNLQIIKATYTDTEYLKPTSFKVKAGSRVSLEIDVRADGVGCGYAITIPGLYDKIEPLRAGVPIVMEFTPETAGTYDITCGMNMIRYGTIIVE